MDARIVKVWRNQSGAVYAASMRAADGARFDVQQVQRRGAAMWVLSWANHPDEGPCAWEHPERYGFERWYCPGHGGGVCQYGACDEIRYTGPVDVAGYEAAQSRGRLTRYAHGDVGYRLQG